MALKANSSLVIVEITKYSSASLHGEETKLPNITLAPRISNYTDETIYLRLNSFFLIRKIAFHINI